MSRSSNPFLPNHQQPRPRLSKLVFLVDSPSKDDFSPQETLEYTKTCLATLDIPPQHFPVSTSPLQKGSNSWDLFFDDPQHREIVQKALARAGTPASSVESFKKGEDAWYLTSPLPQDGVNSTPEYVRVRVVDVHSDDFPNVYYTISLPPLPSSQSPRRQREKQTPSSRLFRTRPPSHPPSPIQPQIVVPDQPGPTTPSANTHISPSTAYTSPSTAYTSPSTSGLSLPLPTHPSNQTLSFFQSLSNLLPSSEFLLLVSLFSLASYFLLSSSSTSSASASLLSTLPPLSSLVSYSPLFIGIGSSLFVISLIPHLPPLPSISFPSLHLPSFLTSPSDSSHFLPLLLLFCFPFLLFILSRLSFHFLLLLLSSLLLPLLYLYSLRLSSLSHSILPIAKKILDKKRREHGPSIAYPLSFLRADLIDELEKIREEENEPSSSSFFLSFLSSSSHPFLRFLFDLVCVCMVDFSSPPSSSSFSRFLNPSPSPSDVPVVWGRVEGLFRDDCRYLVAYFSLAGRREKCVQKIPPPGAMMPAAREM